MADRSELVEAALDAQPEGVAVLDLEERAVFWNRAAEQMTGYCSADLLGREIPAALRPLTQYGQENGEELRGGTQIGRGILVHAQHKLGQDLPAMARRMLLRDAMGERIGTVTVFHCGERLNALPHGETSEGTEVKASQAELDDRLEMEFAAMLRDGTPVGVLWIAVDQAHELRKTHGARACEAMLENVERTLANSLRSGEEIGRWGDDEFLVVAHERDTRTLTAHGQLLAGLARTADFRWWGDRLSLTVSVGAAVAEPEESLAQFLERARTAMLASVHAGGNHTTQAAGRDSCLQL